MTITKAKSVTFAVGVAALATFAAGCGSSSSAGTGSQTVSASSGGSNGLTTHSTSIGTVVADANGHTVYELVGNPVSNTKCTGDCQSIWPPVKSGGKLVVVHGHPVFTFGGDPSAGDTKGQGVKDTWGLWLALDSKGKPIPASGSAPAPAPSQSPSSGGGGGYGY